MQRFLSSIDRLSAWSGKAISWLTPGPARRRASRAAAAASVADAPDAPPTEQDAVDAPVVTPLDTPEHLAARRSKHAVPQEQM